MTYTVPKRTILPSQYAALRLELGFTQPELAHLLNVSTSTICRRETGKVGITREIEFALRFLELRAGRP